MQILYLLQHRDKPIFKIGTSKDVLNRIEQLPEKVCLDRSFYCDCPGLTARRIEQALHVLYRRYHVPQKKGTGQNEWFSVACLDKVKALVCEERNHWGTGKFLPIPARQTITAIQSPRPTERQPPIYFKDTEAKLHAKSSLVSAMSILRKHWRPLFREAVWRRPRDWRLEVPAKAARMLPVIRLNWDFRRIRLMTALEMTYTDRGTASIPIQPPDPMSEFLDGRGFEKRSLLWQSEYQQLHDACWDVIRLAENGDQLRWTRWIPGRVSLFH
jgi:T5orf172 domain